MNETKNKKPQNFKDIAIVPNVKLNDQEAHIIKFLQDEPTTVPSKFGDDNVYCWKVEENNEVKNLWVSNWNLCSQLRIFLEEVGLKDRTYKIRRIGKGFDTKYEVEGA